MKQTSSFTEYKIFLPLIRFALPVLAALFLQTMYGVLVVGQFGTAADVSAVSTGSQVMMTITTVITGLAMGLTIFVGKKLVKANGKRQEPLSAAAFGCLLCLPCF